jgi:hypothetical protein
MVDLKKPLATYEVPPAPAERGEEYRRFLGDPSGDTTGVFLDDVDFEPEPGLAPPVPGEHIGRYELIRSLGKGGMGEVFLARDTKLGRRVAIKFLNSTDPEVGRRYIAEARATALCSHENIVVIHEAEENAGRHYMVLEYLQGHSLTAELTGGRPMGAGRAVELMLPVVRALGCAHAQGIVHRDLKPDNIFVTEGGTIKVLDFGIASAAKDERLPQGPNATVLGTFSYMSPEQWGVDTIDPRTDLWSVGIVLFKLLSGVHPLEGRRGVELAIIADLATPMPSLRTVAPNVPEGLIQVVDRCLKKPKAERFLDAQSLLRALEPFQAGRVSHELKSGESPYAGLASFQETDSGRFFGRAQETAAFLNRLRALPLIAVVGASGAGKSSFVRAGVVPALKRSGEPWQALMVRPSLRPLEMLVDGLLQLGQSTRGAMADLVEREQLLERLHHEPGFAGAAFRAHARRTGRNVLLFIDQFEELYTLVADPAERLAFTTCLASIADDATSPLRVVLSLRSDFLDRVSEDRHFMGELGQGLFLLSAPQGDDLREALVEPAQMAGYRFESSETLEDMLAHLQATQGALPLLQFAASKLWEGRDTERRLLTDASYKAIGGIAGALASHADSVLRELPASAQRLARSVLLALVTPDRTRSLASVEELRELSKDRAAVDELLSHLVRARLLVVQTSAGSATVELVHESLITGWPLLRRWLDEGRDDEAFREQLRTAARQWEARGRAPGLLWSGEAIEEARLWRTRHTDELPKKEQAFLDAALALATRAQRTRKFVLGGVIAMLLVLVFGGTVALVQVQSARGTAVEQARLAEQEAARARAAETQVTEQLGRLREEQAARTQAQSQVEQGQDELRDANRRLERALEMARVESASARTAERQAKTANSTLSKLLAEERKRAALLEKERKKIATELR